MENIALTGFEILGIHRITGEIIFLVPDVLIIEIICGVIIILIGHGGVLWFFWEGGGELRACKTRQVTGPKLRRLDESRNP